MGLHYVTGEWLVDYDGQDVFVGPKAFWTLRILADRMKLDVKTIRYHRQAGRFPALRIKETGQYLVDPVVGEAIASHYLKHKMWLTFRVADGKLVMYNEPYGSRPRGREVLAETGQLHEPGGTALAITAPLEVPDQGVDQR
jgi:hypothetical protein